MINPEQQMVDPLTGMPVQTTLTPPAASNTLGTAKPVFNQTTADVAAGIYGTVDQRQSSMGNRAPLFFKDQTEDGKITRADVIKARTEGYEE